MNSKKPQKDEKFFWYHQSYINSNDAIAITNTSGKILDVNKAFLKMYGYNKKETIGQNVRLIKSTHSTPEMYKEMWENILNPKTGYWKGELINLKKNRKEINVLLTISPIKNNGSITGYMGITIDISEKKKLEQELNKYNRDLEKTVNERAKEIVLTQDTAILALAKLAEYRDPETGEHLLRIRNYSMVLAKELQSMPCFKEKINEHFIDTIYKSSPLHDIGKVGIPDAILLKPGKLTEKEFEIMKTHATIGGDALKAAEKMLGQTSFLSMGKEIAYSHHEKFNGSGYPAGLKGKKIPLSARIMALADVYDALTSKRVYKKAFSHKRAKEIICNESKGHFDPKIVEAFLKREKEFITIKNNYSDKESKMSIMNKRTMSIL